MGGDSKKSAGHWVQAEAKGPVSPQVDTESHPTLQIQVGLAGIVCSKKIGTCYFGWNQAFNVIWIIMYIDYLFSIHVCSYCILHILISDIWGETIVIIQKKYLPGISMFPEIYFDWKPTRLFLFYLTPNLHIARNSGDMAGIDTSSWSPSHCQAEGP